MGSFVDMFQSELAAFLEKYKTKVVIKMVVGLLISSMIFVVYIELLLVDLNRYMWKSKHFLGTIPLERMIERKDSMNNIIKRVN